MGDNYIVSMARKKHLINVHTGTGTTTPTGASLYLGEIAVQHTPGDPALWIKVGSGETSTEYEKFIGETEIISLIGNNEPILGSGYTYSGLPYVTSATSIADAYSAITNVVLDDEYAIAQALNELNARIMEVSGNTGGGTDLAPLSASVISLSAGVKSNEYVVSSALNALNDRIDELSGSTGGGGDIAPLSAAVESLSAAVITISADSGVKSDLLALSAATSAHVNDTDAHVTTSDKTAWTDGTNSGASAWTAVTALSAATDDHVSDTSVHLPAVSSSDNGKVLAVQQGNWTPKMPVTVYGGTDAPGSSLGNNGDIYLQSNPVVIYETDGTTGLLGHNTTAFTTSWQLENLDLTPYKEIRCYFKSSTLTSDTGFTPSVVVTVPLDTASVSSTYGYIGGTMAPLSWNENREYLVTCAVDSTKTKFQVVNQSTLWDITASDANNNGRYLYKIEAYV